MLEDRPAAVLGAHRRRRLVEAFFQRGAARHAAGNGCVEIAQELPRELNAFQHRLLPGQRVAAARHQSFAAEGRQRFQRHRPLVEMGIAAIAGRFVFDDVAGEHDVGVGHVGDDVAGGGVILGEASEELVALAEELQIPVSPTYMGKGCIPEDHPLWAGIVGIQTTQRYGNQIFLESDVVLAIGARFGDRHTGDVDVYRGDRKFIHVDISPEQIGRVFPADLGIVSDSKAALKALRESARERSAPPRETWTDRVIELKDMLERRTDFDDVPIKPPRVFGELNEYFDPDTVFVTAIGLYQIWSGQFQKTYKPRHYLCCGQAGPLGWEVPACIGVKLAAPDKLVVGVVGDYSFQFLMEEVAVAVQYEVPFVLVMVNNGYMGLIRQAEQNYDMNYAVQISYDGPENHPGIDHVGVMKAMGADGMRVTEPGDIPGALDWAIAQAEERRVPTLVEIMVAPEDNAAMGTSIDHIREFETAENDIPDPQAKIPELAG